MKKNKWKSKRWHIVWISEIKYNPYKNVDINKKRPVLIWNNSLSLDGKVIAFYCTTKFDKNNKFLYLVYENSNKKTYVDMRKIFFVNINDINWKTKLGLVKDTNVKNKIKDFITRYFS